MTALPQDAMADLQQRIAELERQLQTAVDERDAAIERQTANALVNFRLKNELRAATERQNASTEILNAIANTRWRRRACAATDRRNHPALLQRRERHYPHRRGRPMGANGAGWPRLALNGRSTGSKLSRSGGHNVPGTVYEENRQIHIPDLDNIDPSMANWPAAAARAAGIRTICGTPLAARHKAIGALIVYRDRLAPFTDDELALQQSFADQAVIAIENARLFNETERRWPGKPRPPTSCA